MAFIEKLRNYKVHWLNDGPLIKLSVFAFTLMIAKLWDPILSLDWYWYLIVSLLAVIKPVKTFFQTA